MAKVVVIFEDTESIDPALNTGITIHIESEDPPLPIKNGDLDVDQATPAQSAARLALEEVLGTAGARQIFAVEG